jgi:hypothetical protein
MKMRAAALSLLSFLTFFAGVGWTEGLAGSWGCQDPKCPLQLYIGYATNLGNTTYKETPREEINDNVGDLDYATTHALYLGAGIPIDLRTKGIFRLAASVTVPTARKVEQLTPDPPADHQRDWSGKTIWGTVEGLWGYPIGCDVLALAGFRWDHWQTSLKNPSNWRPIAVRFDPSDTGDLTVNSYLPLVGLVTNQGRFTFGVLGFPVTFGDAEYHESTLGRPRRLGRITEHGNFNNGYFLEFFSDMAIAVGPIANNTVDASASLFAKLSFLDARGTASWQRDVLDPLAYNPQFSFRRSIFVIGAETTIQFSIPSMGLGGLL